jgi:heme/copper-type cytochrome/quinol oxidase subunit 2
LEIILDEQLQHELAKLVLVFVVLALVCAALIYVLVYGRRKLKGKLDAPEPERNQFIVKYSLQLRILCLFMAIGSFGKILKVEKLQNDGVNSYLMDTVYFLLALHILKGLAFLALAVFYKNIMHTVMKADFPDITIKKRLSTQRDYTNVKEISNGDKPAGTHRKKISNMLVGMFKDIFD